MILRTVIEIDEDKCDGCGECVPACQEGAIRIVGGKARVVSDALCDGLGACLGHCPRGAISLTQREAAPFDESAVARHTATSNSAHRDKGHGCPGTAVRSLPILATSPRPPCAGSSTTATTDNRTSVPLGNWPVQLQLVPPHAPYLRDADLLLVADCVPVACPDFHARFMNGRPVLMGCPKLDDAAGYARKLSHIIDTAGVRSVEVVQMEVPCCSVLGRLARVAVADATATIPVTETVVPIQHRTEER